MGRSLLVTCALLALPLAAAAQPAPADQSRFLMEFRLGALWPQPPVVVDVDDFDPSDTRVAIGGRFGWYPGSAEDRPRVRLDIGVDYAPVGSAEYFDVGLDSYARFEGHWVAIVPAVALEFVHTPRASADFRVGGAFIIEATTFLLERGYDYGEGPFENVCDLRAFEDLCTERFRGAAVVGAGARLVVVPRWRLFVGVDYTWLTIDRHVLVGTVGWHFK